MRSSPGSSSAWARSVRNGAPASTPRRPRSSCRSPASVTSSTRRACAKWERGESMPTRWADAFRSFGRFSINAASTIAGTSRSRAAPSARLRPARSTRTGSCRTSGSTKKSTSRPGPAVGVAGGNLGDHLCERRVQIDVLRIGDADHHEHDVSELHGHRAGRLVGFFLYRAELVIHSASQLAYFFRQSRDVHERREITLHELAHPLIDGCLRLAKAHG